MIAAYSKSFSELSFSLNALRVTYYSPVTQMSLDNTVLCIRPLNHNSPLIPDTLHNSFPQETFPYHHNSPVIPDAR